MWRADRSPAAAARSIVSTAAEAVTRTLGVGSLPVIYAVAEISQEIVHGGIQMLAQVPP